MEARNRTQISDATMVMEIRKCKSGRRSEKKIGMKRSRKWELSLDLKIYINRAGKENRKS